MIYTDDSRPLTKVFLPGESMWAFVLRTQDTRAVVRLNNHPICAHKHGYKCGDVLTVEQEIGPPGGKPWPQPIWKLASLDRQLPLLRDADDATKENP